MLFRSGVAWRLFGILGKADLGYGLQMIGSTAQKRQIACFLCFDSFLDTLFWILFFFFLGKRGGWESGLGKDGWTGYGVFILVLFGYLVFLCLCLKDGGCMFMGVSVCRGGVTTAQCLSCWK